MAKRIYEYSDKSNNNKNEILLTVRKNHYKVKDKTIHGINRNEYNKRIQDSIVAFNLIEKETDMTDNYISGYMIDKRYKNKGNSIFTIKTKTKEKIEYDIYNKKPRLAKLKGYIDINDKNYIGYL